jgi:hypothetical protein
MIAFVETVIKTLHASVGLTLARSSRACARSLLRFCRPKQRTRARFSRFSISSLWPCPPPPVPWSAPPPERLPCRPSAQVGRFKQGAGRLGRRERRLGPDADPLGLIFGNSGETAQAPGFSSVIGSMHFGELFFTLFTIGPERDASAVFAGPDDMRAGRSGRIVDCRVDPRKCPVASQDNRHPVMYLNRKVVGRRRENGARLKRLAITEPRFPEAGDRPAPAALRGRVVTRKFTSSLRSIPCLSGARLRPGRNRPTASRGYLSEFSPSDSS